MVRIIQFICADVQQATCLLCLAVIVSPGRHADLAGKNYGTFVMSNMIMIIIFKIYGAGEVADAGTTCP